MLSACPFCQLPLPFGPGPAALCPRCGKSLRSQARSPFIVIRGREGEASEVVLGAKTGLGRHPSNLVRISDREVSKEHATIDQVDGGFMLRDLGSSNGTFLNGRRVAEAKLKDGDEIALGVTRIVFRQGAGEPPPGRSSGVTVMHMLPAQVVARVQHEEADLGFRQEREITDVELLRRDYEKLRIANEFHRKIGLEKDLSALLDKILHVSFELLDADNGVVLLVDKQTKKLEPAAVLRKEPDDSEVVLSDTVLDRVVQTHEGVLIADAILDSRFASSESIVSQGIRSAMAVPLLSKGELRGVLFLDTRKVAGAFTEKDLRVLAGIATQAAVSLENVELAGRIEAEAEKRAHLSRFLSPALVEQVQRGQLEMAKGGEQTEVTVMFTDIRGFTSIAEQREPQEVVTMLNEYFELMVDIVFATGGVLDKFIGDALMALWGAPVQRPDDASHAVRAALLMQEKIRDYNLILAKKGQPALGVGVGINTGPAVVGNIGSSRRLEYTVIGDAVNIASRLCHMAGPGEILLSESTVRKAGPGYGFSPLPPVQLKGKAKPVPVYKALGFDEVSQEAEPTRGS